MAFTAAIADAVNRVGFAQQCAATDAINLAAKAIGIAAQIETALRERGFGRISNELTRLLEDTKSQPRRNRQAQVLGAL
jgi:hypothetical protein